MDVSGTIRAILNQKSREVFSTSPDTTVFEAIELMDAKNVGALLVVKQERLVGVISERDYTRKVALHGKSSKDTLVNEVLSPGLLVATPHTTIEESMRIMTEHRVRHLPVLDGDTLVGLVSIGDLVNWIISAQSVEIDQLHSYIAGQYPG